ncbi:MAG: PQQ-dependent sugar dehydrogenase [Polyangiaceae bacterium]
MRYPFSSGLVVITAPLAALLFSPLLVGCGGSDTHSQGGSSSTSTGGSTSTAGAGGAGASGGTGGSGGATVTHDYDCSPPDGAAPALQLTQVASGFSRPIQVKAAPGDNDRLFVVEQTGKIWIVQDGQTSAEPFLDIQDIVANPDAPNGYHQEQGLLGLAFHPDYAKNGRFFVNYSEGPFSDNNPKGDTHIVEYKRSSDPNKADPNQVKELFYQAQPFTNHNGGALEFSPKDGFLYIGFGDGGSGGDPMGNGQDMQTWLAKMLRVDVDSGDPYGIPAGNMTGGKPEIWDLGVRNPWRFSFDLCTGDMYIGEVGQDMYEEVDIEKAGQGGKNYGWNTMEGLHCFSPMNGCDQSGLTLPVTEYDHISTGKSITGGYVYRGSKMPGLRGTYFYADYVTKKMWMFAWDGSSASVTPTDITADLMPPDAISSFGQDNFGEVYVVSLYGQIYRIDPK